MEGNPADVSLINDEELLRRMWQQTEDFGRKKEIRTHMYKLREARLKEFYTSGEVLRDVQRSNSSPGLRNKQTELQKSEGPTHADSLLDHSFLSLKSKEIRDSESPTREIQYQNAKNQATEGQWKILINTGTVNDGKSVNNNSVTKTAEYRYTDGGNISYGATNEQLLTEYKDSDAHNYTERVGDASKIVVHKDNAMGNENKYETSKKTVSSSGSSVISHRHSSSKSHSDSNGSLIASNVDTRVAVETMKPSSVPSDKFLDGNTQVITETKTLPDGSTITTTRYGSKCANRWSSSASTVHVTDSQGVTEKKSQTSTSAVTQADYDNSSDNKLFATQITKDSYESLNNEMRNITDGFKDEAIITGTRKDTRDISDLIKEHFIEDTNKKSAKKTIIKNTKSTINNQTQIFSDSGNSVIISTNTDKINICDNDNTTKTPAISNTGRKIDPITSKVNQTTVEKVDNSIKSDVVRTTKMKKIENEIIYKNNNEKVVSQDHRTLNDEYQNALTVTDDRSVHHRQPETKHYQDVKTDVTNIKHNEEGKVRYPEPVQLQNAKPAEPIKNADQITKPKQLNDQYETTYRTEFVNKRISVDVSPTHDAFARSLRSVSPDRISGPDNTNRILRTSNSSLRSSTSPEKINLPENKKSNCSFYRKPSKDIYSPEETFKNCPGNTRDPGSLERKQSSPTIRERKSSKTIERQARICSPTRDGNIPKDTGTFERKKSTPTSPDRKPSRYEYSPDRKCSPSRNTSISQDFDRPERKMSAATSPERQLPRYNKTYSPERKKTSPERKPSRCDENRESKYISTSTTGSKRDTGSPERKTSIKTPQQRKSSRNDDVPERKCSPSRTTGAINDYGRPGRKMSASTSPERKPTRNDKSPEKKRSPPRTTSSTNDFRKPVSTSPERKPSRNDKIIERKRSPCEATDTTDDFGRPERKMSSSKLPERKPSGTDLTSERKRSPSETTDSTDESGRSEPKMSTLISPERKPSKNDDISERKRSPSDTTDNTEDSGRPEQKKYSPTSLERKPSRNDDIPEGNRSLFGNTEDLGRPEQKKYIPTSPERKPSQNDDISERKRSPFGNTDDFCRPEQKKISPTLPEQKPFRNDDISERKRSPYETIDSTDDFIRPAQKKYIPTSPERKPSRNDDVPERKPSPFGTPSYTDDFGRPESKKYISTSPERKPSRNDEISETKRSPCEIIDSTDDFETPEQKKSTPPSPQRKPSRTDEILEKKRSPSRTTNSTNDYGRPERKMSASISPERKPSRNDEIPERKCSPTRIAGYVKQIDKPEHKKISPERKPSRHDVITELKYNLTSTTNNTRNIDSPDRKKSPQKSPERKSSRNDDNLERKTSYSGTTARKCSPTRNIGYGRQIGSPEPKKVSPERRPSKHDEITQLNYNSTNTTGITRDRSSPDRKKSSKKSPERTPSRYDESPERKYNNSKTTGNTHDSYKPERKTSPFISPERKPSRNKEIPERKCSPTRNANYAREIGNPVCKNVSPERKSSRYDEITELKYSSTKTSNKTKEIGSPERKISPQRSPERKLSGFNEIPGRKRNEQKVSPERKPSRNDEIIERKSSPTRNTIHNVSTTTTGSVVKTTTKHNDTHVRNVSDQRTSQVTGPTKISNTRPEKNFDTFRKKQAKTKETCPDDNTIQRSSRDSSPTCSASDIEFIHRNDIVTDLDVDDVDVDIINCESLNNKTNVENVINNEPANQTYTVKDPKNMNPTRISPHKQTKSEDIVHRTTNEPKEISKNTFKTPKADNDIQSERPPKYFMPEENTTDISSVDIKDKRPFRRSETYEERCRKILGITDKKTLVENAEKNLPELLNQSTTLEKPDKTLKKPADETIHKRKPQIEEIKKTKTIDGSELLEESKETAIKEIVPDLYAGMKPVEEPLFTVKRISLLGPGDATDAFITNEKTEETSHKIIQETVQKSTEKPIQKLPAKQTEQVKLCKNVTSRLGIDSSITDVTRQKKLVRNNEREERELQKSTPTTYHSNSFESDYTDSEEPQSVQKDRKLKSEERSCSIKSKEVESILAKKQKPCQKGHTALEVITNQSSVHYDTLDKHNRNRKKSVDKTSNKKPDNIREVPTKLQSENSSDTFTQSNRLGKNSTNEPSCFIPVQTRKTTKPKSTDVAKNVSSLKPSVKQSRNISLDSQNDANKVKVKTSDKLNIVSDKHFVTKCKDQSKIKEVLEDRYYENKNHVRKDTYETDSELEVSNNQERNILSEIDIDLEDEFSKVQKIRTHRIDDNKRHEKNSKENQSPKNFKSVVPFDKMEYSVEETTSEEEEIALITRKNKVTTIKSQKDQTTRTAHIIKTSKTDKDLPENKHPDTLKFKTTTNKVGAVKPQPIDVKLNQKTKQKLPDKTITRNVQKEPSQQRIQSSDIKKKIIKTEEQYRVEVPNLKVQKKSSPAKCTPENRKNLSEQSPRKITHVTLSSSPNKKPAIKVSPKTEPDLKKDACIREPVKKHVVRETICLAKATTTPQFVSTDIKQHCISNVKSGKLSQSTVSVKTAAIKITEHKSVDKESDSDSESVKYISDININNEFTETKKYRHRSPVKRRKSDDDFEKKDSVRTTSSMKCMTVKSIVLNKNDDNFDEVIIDLQRSTSSREPSPDKICFGPVSNDTEKPRYPDKITEPEDILPNPKLQNVSHIPLTEGKDVDDFNRIVEITDEKPFLHSKVEKNDESLLSVSEKVSRFINTAEKLTIAESKDPAPKIPRPKLTVTADLLDDDCLLSVSDKVSKFISTAEQLTTKKIDDMENANQELVNNRSTSNVSQKSLHFTKGDSTNNTNKTHNQTSNTERYSKEVNENYGNSRSESNRMNKLINKAENTTEMTVTPDYCQKYSEPQEKSYAFNSKQQIPNIDMENSKTEINQYVESEIKNDDKTTKSIRKVSDNIVLDRQEGKNMNYTDRKVSEMQKNIERNSPESKRQENRKLSDTFKISTEMTVDHDEKNTTYNKTRNVDITTKVKTDPKDIDGRKSPTKEIKLIGKKSIEEKSLHIISHPDTKSVNLKSCDSPRATKDTYDIINKFQTSPKQIDILSRPSIWEGRRMKEFGKTSDNVQKSDVKLTDIGVYDDKNSKETDSINIITRPNNDVGDMYKNNESLKSTKLMTNNKSVNEILKVCESSSLYDQKYVKRNSLSPTREVPGYMKPTKTCSLEDDKKTKERNRIHPEKTTNLSKASLNETIEERSVKTTTTKKNYSDDDIPGYMRPIQKHEHNVDKEMSKSNLHDKTTSDEEPRAAKKFGVTLRRTDSGRTITTSVAKTERRRSSVTGQPIIEDIHDLKVLEQMMDKVIGYEQRRRIRAQIRIVRRLNSENKKEFDGKKKFSSTVRNNSVSPERKTSGRRKTPSPTRRYSSNYQTTTDSIITERKMSQERQLSEFSMHEKKTDFGDYKYENKVCSKARTPSPETKKIVQTVTKTVVNESPSWVIQRNLRGKTVSVHEDRKPSTRKESSYRSTSPQKDSKKTDCITSSYGIGPTDENGLPLFGVRALRKAVSEKTQENYVGEKVIHSAARSSEIHRSSNKDGGKTFLSSHTHVSSAQDVITRMKNSENEEHEGDTIEDKEARTLLNKFLGAQVLMSGMEALAKSSEKSSNASQVKRMQQLSITTTTKTKDSEKPHTVTRHFQHPITPDKLEDIWDEQTLRLLLEQCTNYDERRIIRARLKQVMAEREVYSNVEASSTMEELQGSVDRKESVQERIDTTKKDFNNGAVTSTQVMKISSSTRQVTKPMSPFAKFRQLDKQNSLQTPPSSPRTPVGGSGAPLFKFTDPALSHSASTVKDRLLQWCQMKTKEYQNIKLVNFSTSWADGLAFCALVHHFLPDAFDYSVLTSQKRRYNFTLAFKVADEQAGIAPLLDVDDMVAMKRPDWKCVFTYVQSIYRRFKDED